VARIVGDWRLPGIFSLGVVEPDADALTTHPIRMRGVVTGRDKEAATTSFLAPAGEEQRVCGDVALGARRRMFFPVRGK